MSDPRYRQLSQLLVQHACALKPGDNVLIEATEIPDSMLGLLMEEVVAAGAHPVVEKKSEVLRRKLLDLGSPEQTEERLKLVADIEMHRMKLMDAYIGLRGSHNITELSTVDAPRMKQYQDIIFRPVHAEQRVNHTRWCVLRWPTPSMAQQASTSLEAFEDFFFQTCLADYAAMAKAVIPLKELMESTDRVRIVAPGTDLRFSIKGFKAIPCTGNYNIPDGECFTAPVRDSVEGEILFNAGSIYRGTPFDQVKLRFEKGRVVEHDSSNNEALGEILDSDEGARYIGEFAIAFHPFITKPMRDILFDEKIRGSLHLALGQAYEEADNGNSSGVHWDLVLMQESGGEIWFDDQLIRKDGRFVVESLEGLNPENLG